MGIKSRDNWLVSECFRKCGNRGELCNDCVCNRNYVPLISHCLAPNALKIDYH